MPDKKREYGEGSIFETVRKGKNGKEYPYYAVKYKAPHMNKPKTMYRKTLPEAKRLLKQLKYDAIKYEQPEIAKTTVEQYMTNWLRNVKKHELKPRSYDTIESTLDNYVFPNIGSFQIANITPGDVQSMINSLVEKKLSYSIVKKAYDAVNACFKLGIIKSEVTRNPCVGVALPKAKKKKTGNIRFFNDDEIEAVSKTSILRHGNGELVYRLGYAVLFLMHTGLRIGEFLALTWNAINYESKTVTVRKSVVRVKNRDETINKKTVSLMQDSVKTDAGDRVVPLGKTALMAIKELQKITGEFDYVASTKRGKIVHERAFDRMLRDICARCGVEPCGAHVLRHTFASLLFRKGVDVKTVSKLLGHSDISITYNTYIHLIQEQERQAVDLLDDL